MTAAVTGRSAKVPPSLQLCEVLDKLRLDPKSTSNTDKPDVEPRDLDASNGMQDLLASADGGLGQLELMHGRVVRPVLESLLPRSSCWANSQSPCSQSKENQLSLEYLKFLTYACTNNFAGFGLAGITDATALPLMYDYLHPMMSALLEQDSAIVTRFRTIGDIPSSKPMAETFFRCAIEAGDTQAVASLCYSSDLGINANEQVCVIDGRPFTPIERSAALHHLPLTQLLVRMGVDVNKTFEWLDENGVYQDCSSRRFNAMYRMQERQDHDFCPPSGALEYALSACNKTTSESLNLVSALLQAGGRVHTCPIARTLEQNQTELFKLLVAYRIDQSCSSWIRAGILHLAVHSQNRGIVRSIFEHIHSTSTDIDHIYRPGDREAGEKVHILSDSSDDMDDDRCIWLIPTHPRTLIDIVALRGDLVLFRDLLHYAPTITDNTLTAAVRSRNQELIELILDMGALSINFSPFFHTTPYAEAIRSKEPAILELIQVHGGLDHMDESYHYGAALSAAAEIGHIKMVSDLLKSPEKLGPAILGHALAKAAFEDHTDVAIILLEAGASTCVEETLKVLGCRNCSRFGVRQHDYRAYVPLMSATTNRNAALVQALLEHDAEVDSGHQPTIMEAAVEWGNMSILKDLIAARGIGRGNSAAVNAAVWKEDRQALRILLDAGYGKTVRRGCDPLMTAVEVGNIEVLQELLAYGANPLWSQALFRTLHESREMFMFLLRSVGRYDPNPELEELLHEAMVTGHPDVIPILTGDIDSCSEGNPYQACDILTAYGTTQEACRSNAYERCFASKIKPDAIIWDQTSHIRNFRSVSGSRVPLETALLVAIQTQRLEMVRLIVDNGADVNFPAVRGVKRTPLQKAAEVGSCAIVQYLIEKGANINAPPAVRCGGTALQLAAIGGYLGIFELLLESDADVAADKSIVNGRFPIEGAAEHGRFDTVQYLLDLGAYDTEQLNTALQLAKKYGHSAISDILEEALAKIRTDGDKEISEDIIASSSTQQCICNICQKELSNASAKARHMRTVHGGITSRSNFICDICSAGFNRKDLLKRHKADKHEDSKVPCQWCGNKYRKDYLKQHEGPCQQRQPEVMELD